MFIHHNEEIIEIDKVSIGNGMSRLKKNLFEKYDSIDIVIRSGLKIISRKILDDMVKNEPCDSSQYRVPKKQDANIHLMNILIDGFVDYINKTEVYILSENGKISFLDIHLNESENNECQSKSEDVIL